MMIKENIKDRVYMVRTDILIRTIESEIESAHSSSIDIGRDKIKISVKNQIVDIEYKLDEKIITDQQKNKFINLIASNYDAGRNQNGK